MISTDLKCEKRMEPTLFEIHSGFEQEKTGHLDWRPQCRPNRVGFGASPATSIYLNTFLLDLANPKKNWNKTPGYTEAETTAFKNILNAPDDRESKLVDVWRKFHPTDRQYTYFSYRFNCRMKGIGWRLDMCKQLLVRYRSEY
jgi:hypothetical protein